jgi:hypothetical protein
VSTAERRIPYISRPNAKIKFVKLSKPETENPKPGQIFKADDIGKIFSWDAVSEIHRTRNGIYQRGGRLISLLTDFGKINQCYPDFHGAGGDTIFYTGAGRRGDQRLDVWNKSLFGAIETEIEVPLFCKLKVGAWQFLGFWRVAEARYVFDEPQKRMVWKFTLKKGGG